MLFCVIIIKAQNFPIQYKIERVFDECSACHAKSKSVWKLVHSESYSEIIRKAIEDFIHRKYSLPDILNYSQKPCEITRTSKHAWIEKKLFQNENLSKEDFSKFEKLEKELNEIKRVKEERELKEEKNANYEKKNFVQNFEKKYKNLQDKKNKARELLQKNEMQKYLKLQLEVCNEWSEIDSLKESYINYINFWADNKNEAMNKITDQMYCDLSEYLSYSIINKNLENNNLILKKYFKYGYNFDEIVNNYDRFKNSCNIDFLRNVTNSLMLVGSYHWWDGLIQIANKVNEQSLFEDYKNFEKYGLIKNADSLIFLIKGKRKRFNINVSPNASENIKYSVKNDISENYFHVSDMITKNYDNFIKIDNNFYKVTYRHSEGALLDDWNFRTYYFYLTKNYDIVIVNKSSKEPSEKKKLKIINQCTEIRNRDLNIKK